jgi:hypothetical protein
MILSRIDYFPLSLDALRTLPLVSARGPPVKQASLYRLELSCVSLSYKKRWLVYSSPPNPKKGRCLCKIDSSYYFSFVQWCVCL